MIDHFERLDTEVWLPHYLPHWSSRAESAATYTVEDSELRLTIPVEQGLWCAGDHEPPLRVSGVQSGVLDGQLPFRDDLVVREHQETHWGWTPHYGRIEIRARMDLSPRSMASLWMSGLEDEPDHCGEICVFEIFGDAPRNVGCGIKHFRDPALTWEFDAPELDIDVAEHHVYAADWQPGPGRLQRRRRAREDRPPSARLPAAGDGRGLRLPGQGRRLRSRAAAGRGLSDRRLLEQLAVGAVDIRDLLRGRHGGAPCAQSARDGVDRLELRHQSSTGQRSSASEGRRRGSRR